MRVGLGGITGTNITSIGLGVSVGGGGGEAIKPTFLLRDDFLTDEAAPLASPRTAEPGPGTLTLVQDDGEFSISDGRLQIDPPVSTNRALRASTDDLGSDAGVAVIAVLPPVNAARLAIGYDDLVDAVAAFKGALLMNIVGVSSSSAGGAILYPRANMGASVRAAVINLGGNHAALCIDDTLVWVTDSKTQTRARILLLSGGELGDAMLDTFRAAKLGGTWLDDFGIATDRIAGGVSAGATFSHEADCLVEWTQTALPSSGYTDVWLRRIDADNGIVVSTASDGTVELYAVESGNWSQLGFTSAGTAANGHRFVVVCDGADIRVYSSNTLRITATSSVGQSATAGRLDALGTGGAVSNVVSWPRTLSGIAKQWLDAAIAD